LVRGREALQVTEPHLPIRADQYRPGRDEVVDVARLVDDGERLHQPPGQGVEPRGVERQRGAGQRRPFQTGLRDHEWRAGACHSFARRASCKVESPRALGPPKKPRYALARTDGESESLTW